MSTKILRKPTMGEWKFDEKQWPELASRLGIKTSYIMAANKQTGSGTAKKWLEGSSDMLVSSLTRSCTHLRLDLLQFFTYDGHKFRTSAEDLYRAECAGISIADLLAKRGIDTYNELSFNHSPTEQNVETREEVDKRIIFVNSHFLERERDREPMPFSITEVIDKIAQIKDDSFAKIAQTREDMQEIIDAQARLIAALKKENRELGGKTHTMNVGDV